MKNKSSRASGELPLRLFKVVAYTRRFLDGPDAAVETGMTKAEMETTAREWRCLWDEQDGNLGLIDEAGVVALTNVTDLIEGLQQFFAGEGKAIGGDSILTSFGMDDVIAHRSHDIPGFGKIRMTAVRVPKSQDMSGDFDPFANLRGK
jgi:hypothetical protein